MWSNWNICIIEPKKLEQKKRIVN